MTEKLEKTILALVVIIYFGWLFSQPTIALYKFLYKFFEHLL